MSTVRLKVMELQLDDRLYPRFNINSQAVGYIVEAMANGAELPPIIVCAKTKKVVDGFHRCRAHLRLYGDGAEIDCILKEYRTDADRLEDAYRYNARHGTPLDRHDRVHSWLKAKAVGLSMARVAKALGVKLDSFKELVERKMAKTTKNQEQPVKPAIEWVVRDKKKLTAEQVDVNTKLGGNRAGYYVNQIIMLLEAGLINLDDPKILERLEYLQKALAKFLRKVPVAK